MGYAVSKEVYKSGKVCYFVYREVGVGLYRDWEKIDRPFNDEQDAILYLRELEDYRECWQ